MTEEQKKALKKAITLKIIGMPMGEGASDGNIEFVTEGNMYKKGKALYLVYDEGELEGLENCKIRLKVADDAIHMKRMGESIAVDTGIIFKKGKRFTGFYNTPYGPVEMEVLTNDIKNNLTFENAGSLNIDYNISLKGLIAEARNRLDIHVM